MINILFLHNLYLHQGCKHLFVCLFVVKAKLNKNNETEGCEIGSGKKSLNSGAGVGSRDSFCFITFLNIGRFLHFH